MANLSSSDTPKTNKYFSLKLSIPIIHTRISNLISVVLKQKDIIKKFSKTLFQIIWGFFRCSFHLSNQFLKILVGTQRINKGNKTYVTFSERIFQLNWCKLKLFREVKMKKMFVTFPFNERIYVTVQRRKERVRLLKKRCK